MVRRSSPQTSVSSSANGSSCFLWLWGVGQVWLHTAAQTGVGASSLSAAIAPNFTVSRERGVGISVFQSLRKQNKWSIRSGSSGPDEEGASWMLPADARGLSHGLQSYSCLSPGAWSLHQGTCGQSGWACRMLLST